MTSPDRTHAGDEPAATAEPSVSNRSLFEVLGGGDKLQAIVDHFVDRVFEDQMIGFLFKRADRARIKQKEFEFAARHLGAQIKYTGLPLARAHKKHGILGGQFARRLQILKETLTEYEVPSAVSDHWLEHTRSLRPLITTDATNECKGEPPVPRAGETKIGTTPEVDASVGVHVVTLRRS